jgi:hypothetical protein
MALTYSGTRLPGIFYVGDLRAGAMNRGSRAMATKLLHKYLAKVRYIEEI